MTPAQLQTIEEIYRATLDQEPDQISAFLDTACEGDEVLRRKVEALLSSRHRADSFIETSAVGLATRIIQNGQADLLVGRIIGHYKLSERIGTGGMGDVYLATDIRAGRKAALKLLPVRFTGDAERLKRFQQEARTVVGLNHPNILTVYEIGEDHSIHYIASELIEGETVRQRLDRGRMQLSEALDLAIQVASALAAAHEAGIVHRDIKPENIMLRPDGYVKVLDFGIAKLAEQELPVTMPKDEALLLVETNLGSILGTVRYMSPEQACGAPVDKSTDIWSLGVVLYEMVSGHAPFTGDTPREVMSAILEMEPPLLTKYVARTPAELQQIISKTLRKDRKKRYRSAHELLKALKDLRRNLEFESFFASGFFEEVKRRKVYRVAAAYIIAGAGIIQLASVAFPAWDLPNWALRLVIVLLLIGFPLALVLGWVFDLTSQGIRATPSAIPGTHRRRNAIMLVATGVIISAAAGFFLLPRVSAYKVDKSIAVLPFESLGEQKENTSFADGVQDDILTKLAKIGDLKVISRNSVMDYRGKRNVRQIGDALRVSHVLEGSARRSGNRIRLNAQLIDTRTDTHVWAEQYDRDLNDVFAVQSEIAQKVAERLHAKLSASEKASVEEKPTQDLVAYDFYVRALSLISNAQVPTMENLVDLYEAVDLLNQAVARDPNFFLAYCQLAFVHDLVYQEGFDRTPARLALAKSAIDSAFRLRPDSGEARLALSWHLYWGYSDYDGARAELAVVQQSLPNNPRAFELAGLINRTEGRWADAIRNLERACELDPRNVPCLTTLSSTYYWLHDYDQVARLIDRVIALLPAQKEYRIIRAWLESDQRADTGPSRAAIEKILTKEPGSEKDPFVAHWRLGLALYDRDLDAAGALAAARSQRDGGWGGRDFWLGRVARLKGDVAAARAAFMRARTQLEEELRDHPDDISRLSHLGLIDAALGRKEEALSEGRRAMELVAIAPEAIKGPYTNEGFTRMWFAIICAWAGERELALEQLEVLAKIPGGPSYGRLSLDPVWDPLRGDPRFEKIVAAAKAASR